MILRVFLLLALGASALHAARPWPVFKRSYISAQAGPAVEFELSSTSRWYGTPGETVPGTSWTVQAIRFMPGGVFLIDREKALACALAENHSPWYEPKARVVEMPALATPAGKPEAPPAPRSAAWYAELARQYAFVGRTSESAVMSERALALGHAGDPTESKAPVQVEKASEEDAAVQDVRERIRAREEERLQKKKKPVVEEAPVENVTGPAGAGTAASAPGVIRQ